MFLPSGEPKRPATYKDLLSVPDNLVAEIVDGELVTSPRPSLPHANVSSVMGFDLGGPFHGPPGGVGPGGWWILYEPELHLGNDVLVPDLAGWRRERVPSLPAEAAMTLAPDWICEVLSPQSAGHDRVRKMAIYAKNLVPFAWIVDPSGKTLEVYRLEGGRWLQLSTHSHSDHVRAEPFAAVELALERWWA